MGVLVHGDVCPSKKTVPSLITANVKEVKVRARRSRHRRERDIKVVG